MKKVMVFGTFDILHPGHINFFNQALNYGDQLIIILAQDKTVKDVKGRFPLNNIKKRAKQLTKLNLAKKIIFGTMSNKYDIIKKEKPDVICLGYDQKAFTGQLKNKIKEFGLLTKIIRLKSYKPEIYKSSKIRIRNINHKT